MENLKSPKQCGRLVFALLFALALPWAELRAAQAPASPAAIASSIQALVNLKDGDETGFAAQANVLLNGGEKALDAVEAELKKQSGAKAFRLQRVRDMFCWPLDVKGVITMTPSDKEVTSRFDVGSQVIATAVNGTPTPDYETFSAAVKRAQASKKGVISMDLIKDGRKRTVEIPDGKLGYQMGKYPYVLAHYIHKGERDARWDEDIKVGLQNFGLDWWHEAGTRLHKAMNTGCRDPMLLSCSMHALNQSNRPSTALAVYSSCKPSIKEKMWDGGEAAYYEMHKGLALLYTGDVDGAVSQLTSLLKNTEGPVGYVRGYLALAVQEKDPEQAIALLKEATAKQSSYLWDAARYELLKKMGRYGEAADLVAAYGGANGKVLAGWMRSGKANAKLPEPAHWAVVYRNDFVVPEAVFRMFEYDKGTLEGWNIFAENGALVMRGSYWSGAMLWHYYKNARVDVDVHMTDIEKYIDNNHRHNSRGGVQFPEVTVSGLFTYQREAKGTEVGFGYNVFRRLVQIMLFNNPFYQSYLPAVDPGAQHHLTVDWVEGRARFFIDGKKVSEQFYPKEWFGKIGLRTNQGQVRFDNLEIRVPSGQPVDNDAIIAGYKNASDAMARKDLSAALSALEEVADLQPQNQDFQRLYAAYIEAGRMEQNPQGKDGWRKESARHAPVDCGGIAAWSVYASRERLRRCPDDLPLYDGEH